MVAAQQVDTGHLRRQGPSQLLRLVTGLPVAHRAPDGVDLELEGQWVVEQVALGQCRLADPGRAVEEDEARHEFILLPWSHGSHIP